MTLDLPDNTILLVEAGSTAYGLHLPGHSDHDEIAVYVEHPTEIYRLDQSETKARTQRSQPEGVRSQPGDTDRSIYPLRKFIQLAVAGNPTILAALWCPAISASPEGRELQRMRHEFVGRHIIPKYRGYMRSQAERLLGTRGGGHGKRGGGGREELIAAHGYDTKYAMHVARLGYTCIELITTGDLALPMDGQAGDWLRALRRGEIPFSEWWDEVLYLNAFLGSLADNDQYRPDADREQIQAWMINTHLELHPSMWYSQ